MEVRVLGPLQVADGDALVSLGPKERVVLAGLVAARGRIVTEDRLVDVVWGAHPPPTARKTLQGYVHRIRRAIGPEAIARADGGYTLGATVDVDINGVESAVASARSAVSQGRLDRAAELFDDAVRRFRGEPLVELEDDTTAAGIRSELAELELTLHEERWVNELERGHHADIIGGIESLVRRDPTRERAWCLLVTALGRSGRRADALDAVARAKRALALELGIEPGPRLRELELAILEDGSSATAQTQTATTTRRVQPYQPSQTVPLVHTPADSIQELRREHTATDLVARTRRTPRRAFSPGQVRDYIAIVGLLGIVVCAQLAVASAFLPWVVVTAGEDTVVSNGFGDYEDSEGFTHSYGGELVVGGGILMMAVVGVLAGRFAETGRRGIAVQAAAAGALGGIGLGQLSRVSFEKADWPSVLAGFGLGFDVSPADSAVGGGLRLLLAACIIAVGLAVVTVVAVLTRVSSPTQSTTTGGRVAMVQVVTAAIIAAVVVRTNATSTSTAASDLPPSTIPVRSPASPVTTTSPPTTRPPVTTANPSTTAPPSTLFPTPAVQQDFANSIPDVDGFDLVPTSDVIWPVYDLPGGAQAYAMDVGRDGAPIGQLVVAGRPEPNDLFSTYARSLFNESVPVFIEATAPLDDGGFSYSSSDSLAHWQSISNTAVIRASLPERDAGQWVWQHRDLIWAVRGQLAAEEFVASLILAQDAGRDPFDFQGLSGRLLDRLPEISGVTYYGLTRSEALTAMAGSWSWPCTEAFDLSYVPSVDDMSPDSRDDRSLTIEVSSIGKACGDGGFVEQLRSGLTGSAELRPDTVAGRAVYRSDDEVLYIDDDVLVHLSTATPAALSDMAVLVERIIAGQPG